MTDAIAAAVVAAITKASADKSTVGACGAELLQRMDSLRLMIAFADIQDRLGVRFEPEQLMQLFLCQSIEDMVAVLEQSGAQADSVVRDGQSPRALVARPAEQTSAPLSFSQERLWFVAQLGLTGAAYNIPYTLRLGGELDVAALERSVAELVRRHESLRTRFASIEGEPFQVIDAPQGFRLRIQDLRPLAEEAAAQARRLIQAEAQEPFDLASGTLFRPTLLRLSSQGHLLLLTMHHIVSDGWSLEVLTRELGVLYEAYARGGETPLPEPVLQYADYALWQRGWLQGDVLEGQLAYWHQQLAGAPAALELPTDRPRPAVPSYRGASRPLQLSKELTQDLQELGRRERATLFMVLLAAYQLVLSRWSGQEDVVVGSPIAGRTHRELEGLVGFFVNTLALRTQVRGEQSFRELLAQVKEAALEAYAHQDLPFEKLVAELRPQRDLSRHPVFQTLFAMQNMPEAVLDLTSLKIEQVGVELFTSEFDLTLSLSEHAGVLRGTLGYATDLFDAQTIDRLMAHWERVLEQVVADPGRRIRDVDLLSDAERRQLLVEWNDTAAEYPQDRCVYELFEAQVERTPGAVAVEYADERLTYAQLNSRANRLAHHLRTLGVGPERRVALCVERSLEMVVGLLAVLKAGGAYVPLDPAYPAERLAFMLEDSAPIVLLTDSQSKAVLRRHPRELVTLELGADANADAWAHQPEINLTRYETGLAPWHLAYVIYTSGSTGTPKGVGIEHRNLINFLGWVQTKFSREALERTLFATSLSFDLATYECFAPLVVGATVKVVQNALELLERPTDVTLINLVPSALERLVESGCVPSGVRVVNVAGEPLKRGLVDRLFATTGVETLHNLYGPSETTTYSTCVEMRRGGEFAAHIGRPIGNTRIYILDERREVVPVGVRGEIYIAGAGVARGYLERAELTAQRFVADPFGRESGARMYRTGDLGRWRLDGTIEFLGRNDHQVKLRGFRIELGEIEAKLLEHPGVSHAVAIVREDKPGDQRLVAYYTSSEAGLGIDVLRSHLARGLPDYMVPAAYVRLEALPLTPNGKLDRQALPVPDGDAYAASRYEAPQGPVETTIAGIWSEVLGVERVSRHDNFFGLGGHSLLATRVLSRAREALSVEVQLRTLFESQTLQELAEHVKALVQDRQGLTAPLLRAGLRPERLSPSYAQERLWFVEQLGLAGAAYNMPCALRLEGELDVAALECSVAELVRRHESLHTRFVSIEGEPFQVIDAPEGFRLPIRDLGLEFAEKAPVEARRLIQAEAEEPFDLASGSLFRPSLLRLSSQEHLLLLTMHHIVSDGWSLEVLTRELAALYEAYARGKGTPLQEPTLQYADYALWQRSWLQGDVLERQLAYWRQQLAGAPAALELPTDRPRPAVPSYRGASRPLQLSKELTQDLQELGRRERATLFMVLLAAYQLVLSRWSGQEDVVVGSPIAGRTHRELEGLVGFFVNTLALRTQVRGEQSFRELLAQVKETALEAYAHQDLPFEKLVAELRPQRDLSRYPVFQTVFAMQNVPEAVLDLTSLKIRRAGAELLSSKFDLTLYMSERAGVLRGTLEYATDLFDAQTIDRLMGHWERVLEQVVADPGRRIRGLDLLSDAERRQLLVEWNETAAGYPQDCCVHELFEAQAARTPDAVAVVYEGSELRYRELNARANQLARHLSGLGVGPDVIVGLCMERSIEMVVGLLGILKAGGAYLPLDPQYPAERLAFMLKDAAAPVLLTQSALTSILPDYPGIRVRMDGDWARIAALDDGPVKQPVSPRNLAYVIYTSGSTGVPKGAMNEHRGMVNRIFAQVEIEQYRPDDVCSHSTSISFVDAVFETLGPLCNGLRLVIIPAEALKDGEAMAALVARERVTQLVTVPSLARVMTESASVVQGLSGLRIWTLSGEEVPADLLIRLQQLLPGCEFMTWYGSSEVSSDAAFYRSTHFEGVRVPLGRPVPNVQLYVLDQQGQPVPIGVTGEIYVGGVGVGRGYINLPELSEERFLPDHVRKSSDGRLYKTGDLGRWNSNGMLEYLGRGDLQIKIRGCRIELGEIESRLREYPGVHEAVALGREDVPGDKRLVAYYTTADGEEVTAEALKVHLVHSLPNYMVPAAYVRLEELPLTPNGKLDRKALPVPDENAYTASRYEAPLGPVETAVAEVWSEVLGVERVGRHDNFFGLGGHSLLATRVLSRVREALSVEVKLRALFESQTLQELAEHVKALARDRQGLTLPPLKAGLRPERLSPSYAQERLWFVEQLGLTGAAYNMPYALRLEGELDVAALERSVAELVRRHESLRTRFVSIEGEPFQVIDAPEGFRLPIRDLGLEFAEEAQALARRLIQAEVEQPFDLASGSLFRPSLLRLSSQEHLLLLTMHHIVSDAWSLEVLTRELGALYEAYVQGKKTPLQEPVLQYADYSRWQRSWLQGDVLERQLAYWRQQLAGAPAALELPTDRPRPAVPSHRGARRSLQLSKELTRDLQELSCRERATLFMVLLAAYQLVLARWSGQEDVVVGSPIAGRTHRELERLVGLFVNTLALRTQVRGEQSFRELLAQVKEAALEAYAHQDLPFEKLVAELQSQRDLSRQPVFQASFAMQNTPEVVLELTSLKIEWTGGELLTSKFDLTLYMFEYAGALRGTLEYATDLFDAQTIERLIGHWERVLEQVVADPGRRIRDLDLLSDAERRLLLVEWNETATEYPQDRCVHELFEEQVKRTPKAVAVVYEASELSYEELNARASRLAHHLRGLGVGPDVIVGLCVERSVEMVVGLLGILKAGGAYLPLDPQYPAERLAFMLKDTAAPVLVTQSALTSLLPDYPGITVRIDGDWAQIAELNDGPLQRAVSPNNLAYVIYTSGSTGVPKGVMVEHRNVVRLAYAIKKAIPAESSAVVTVNSSIVFDGSLKQLVRLLDGMTLMVVPNAARYDSLAFASTLESHNVDVIDCVPTQLKEYGEVLAAARKPLAVLVGGEAISPVLWRKVNAYRHIRLFNVYGPTECGAVTTVFAAATGGANPYIGRPIANSRVYVLDVELEPVPIGVAGELYIAGAGVARGYLNRPGLTAQRFVADPFGSPGERMYRTGDRVRWRSDRELEFLGRNDHQVKLRGFRIELGEIQAKLMEHPGVSQAVVIVREDNPDDKRLVAYYTSSETGLGTEVLRSHLAQSVPDYMLPSAYVRLEALPLTPNGKLDRKALPAPDSRPTAVLDDMPTTPVQRTLAAIWAEVLKVDGGIKIQDNFFELGGDSILAMRVVARLRRLGIKLSVRDLFEATSLAELALRAAPLQAPQNTGSTPDVDIGIAPIQKRFLLRKLKNANRFNQAVFLTCRVPLKADMLTAAFAEIVKHHAALRLRFDHASGGWRQRHGGVSDSFVVKVVDVGSGDAREQEIISDAVETAHNGMDITHGPIIAVTLFNFADGRDQSLHIACHHLAIDTTSWAILIDDLEASYEYLSLGLPVLLPPQTTPYWRWVDELRKHAQNLNEELEIEYWRHASASVPALPYDFPNSENSAFTEKAQHFSLSPEDTKFLLRTVQGVFDVSAEEWLLSILVATICSWTHSDSCYLTLEGHGRDAFPDHLDLTQTIGWFTSIYPAIFKLDESGDLVTVARNVKAQLSASKARGANFPILRYMRNAAAVFEVREPEISFNYFGQISLVRQAGMFMSSGVNPGKQLGPAERRLHKVDILAIITDGKLGVDFVYSGDTFSDATIVGVVEKFSALACKSLAEFRRLHSNWKIGSEGLPGERGRRAGVS